MFSVDTFSHKKSYINLNKFFKRYTEYLTFSISISNLLLRFNIHVIFSKGEFQVKSSIIELEKSFVLACFIQALLLSL